MTARWLLVFSAGLALMMGCASPPVLARGSSDVAKVIEDVGETLAANYVFAGETPAIMAQLQQRHSRGDYDRLGSADEIAQALSADLVEITQDAHFSIRYSPDSGTAPAFDLDEAEAAARSNFGFRRVAVLPGNIGYIDLRQFAPIEPAESTAHAALDFVAGTDAVIFDVRQNGGGAPSMVQYLVSHFLEPGGRTLINTFVSRDYEYPNQMWSLPSHPAGNRPDVPLYVLTSARTGSAGEAFPYHLQALERATLIGETTYGAGNPGGTFLSDAGFSIFVSTGSARNPVTGTNWEGTGVVPHIETDAEAALDTALRHAYAALLETDPDDGARRTLEWALEGLTANAAPVSLNEAELARYAGAYGIRSFSVEDGQLMYSRDGRPGAALQPLGDHRFRLDGDDNARFVFVVDGSGPADRMDLHLGDGRVLGNARTD